MSRTSVGTSARSTGNNTACSQTSYLKNYCLQTLVLLIRHTRNFVILSLQQPSCQFHAVARIIINYVKMRSANIFTRFFYGLQSVKQLVLLLPPCYPILMRNEKITDLRLSITSTARTPVGWH